METITGPLKFVIVKGVPFCNPPTSVVSVDGLDEIEMFALNGIFKIDKKMIGLSGCSIHGTVTNVLTALNTLSYNVISSCGQSDDGYIVWTLAKR